MYESDNNQNFFAPQTTGQTFAVAKTFMANVFLWMTAAMAVTALTAYYFASSASLLSTLVNFQTGRMTGLGWIVTLAPFAFVLLMSFGFQRLSVPMMTLLFMAFSILMGMSLSFILVVYTSASVFKTFLVTAGMFGIMAVLGYTTKTDLTRFGSIMMMGMIGIFIAMIINMFMQSPMMDYIVSIIGVLVFTGLTAYDVQKLKRIGSGMNMAEGNADIKKLSILGALTLYLDFINLFLFLLRFLGDRK
ncbi:MAG: Bax inhibitor-1/YccA family protein [Bacteroidota bacterium]|nr:Bax inhibitor-1/YccA family protein [Bacteroidota bacterium]